MDVRWPNRAEFVSRGDGRLRATCVTLRTCVSLMNAVSVTASTPSSPLLHVPCSMAAFSLKACVLKFRSVLYPPNTPPLTSLSMIKSLLAPLLLVSVATAATAKNILLTNDDGWAVAIIRAQLDSLDAAGHSVSFQL